MASSESTTITTTFTVNTPPGCSGYQCIFCGKGIEPTDIDPCALIIIAGIDRPRAEQREQLVFCHIRCIKERAFARSAPYINEPCWATIGELAKDKETSA